MRRHPSWMCLFLMPVTGCLAAPSASSILPPFEHPLFYQEKALFSTSKSGVLPPEMKKGSPRRCSLGFTHPVLNRCYDIPRSPFTTSSPAAMRAALVNRARGMLSHPSYRAGQVRFEPDCSGLVLAVFAQAGLPIHPHLSGSSAERSRVAAMYQVVEDMGRLHHRQRPEIGDLIFFDNTNDRDKDGKLDDPLTHVGIVERVDEDGTISFIHRSRRGVLRYRMNLLKPHLRRDPASGKVLNHYLRVDPKGSRAAQKRLTGELFRAFGTLVF